MHRSILIAISAAAILVTPALAQKTPDTNATNLNSSRSNVTDQQRMGGGGGKGTTTQGTTTPGTTTTGTDRMGGGGGKGK